MLFKFDVMKINVDLRLEEFAVSVYVGLTVGSHEALTWTSFANKYRYIYMMDLHAQYTSIAKQTTMANSVYSF